MLILTHSWEISLFSSDKYKKTERSEWFFANAERFIEIICQSKISIFETAASKKFA